jgi:hypothetical protein
MHGGTPHARGHPTCTGAPHMHGGTQHARGHPTCTGTPQNTETMGHDCPTTLSRATTAPQHYLSTMTALLPWQAQKDCTYNTHASLPLCHLWQTELACPLSESIAEPRRFQLLSTRRAPTQHRAYSLSGVVPTDPSRRSHGVGVNTNLTNHHSSLPQKAPHTPSPPQRAPSSLPQQAPHPRSPNI